MNKKNFIIILLLSLFINSCNVDNKEKEWTSYKGNFQNTGFNGANGPKEVPSIKWKFKTGGKVLSSPCVFNNTIFFGSYDKYFYAVDQETGKEKWKFKVGKVLSNPTISNGLVLFSADSHKLSYNYKPIYYVYAFDVNTGQVKWKYKVRDLVFASPVVLNDLVYFTAGEKLYALNINTGKLKWKFYANIDALSITSPVLYEKSIFFSCSNYSDNSYVYSVDTTGLKNWNIKVEKYPYRDLLVSNKMIFSATRNHKDGSFLRAIDTENGNIIWKIKLDSKTRNISASKGVLYCCDLSNMYAIDISDGNILWKIRASSEINSSPTISSDGIIYHSGEQCIVANDIIDGKELWKFYTESDVSSSFALSDGEIYFGSNDGYLYKLK